MTDDIRDELGRIKKGHSLNKAGRPPNSKNKVAKAKMENQLNSIGPKSLKNIFDMGEAAMLKGDANTAYKCFAFVGGQYLTLTLHNDRMSYQMSKDRPEGLSDEQEEELQQGTIVKVNFKRAEAV